MLNLKCKIYLARLPLIESSVIISQPAIPSVFYQLKQAVSVITSPLFKNRQAFIQITSFIASFAASQVFILMTAIIYYAKLFFCIWLAKMLSIQAGFQCHR